MLLYLGPRMCEKLLMHLQYECSRYKIELPWDSIAHRLHPGSSGGAILQHLNRLRGTLVAEGHLVPPIVQKPGSKVFVDPKIRGYIRRDMDGEDNISTRPVGFDEVCEDRRFNIPNAYDNPVKTPRSAVTAQPSAAGGGGSGTGRGRKPSKAVKVKAESPDPADLDSDEEYTPGARMVRKTRRAQPKRSYVEEDEPVEEDEGTEIVDAATAPEPQGANAKYEGDQYDDQYDDQETGGDEEYPVSSKRTHVPQPDS